MTDKAKLAKLLRALTQIVESSTEAELEALGRATLSDLTASSKIAKKKVPSGTKVDDSVDVEGIIQSMRYLASRENGVIFLERQELGKRSLERIARRLDLPVLREDTYGRLVEKIVEASIGRRLNSEAIRGEAVIR